MAQPLMRLIITARTRKDHGPDIVKLLIVNNRLNLCLILNLTLKQNKII